MLDAATIVIPSLSFVKMNNDARKLSIHETHRDSRYCDGNSEIRNPEIRISVSIYRSPVSPALHIPEPPFSKPSAKIPSALAV